MSERWDATNSVRLCDRCEDEQGIAAGADAGDTACAACGQHTAPHIYPALVSLDSMDGLMAIAQAILDRHYPADIPLVCDRNSPDPGPRLTAALRDCIEARQTAASRELDS